MSDNVTNILNAMRAASAQPGGSGKRPYKPIETCSGYSDTLRVNYSNGNVELIRYGAISSVLYGRQRGGISIQYAGGYATMLGRNLRPLMECFEKEKATHLHPFDPARHLPPKEGEPVIEEIVFSPPGT